MFRYPNEAKFSQAFCKHLREKGWFIQRIETALTGRGVPDIYAISPDKIAVWFELKRIHISLAGINTPVHITWRLGQQAWLYQVTQRGQKCYTIVCFDDTILQIPHDRLYANDRVFPYEKGIKQFYRIGDL